MSTLINLSVISPIPIEENKTIDKKIDKHAKGIFKNLEFCFKITSLVVLAIQTAVIFIGNRYALTKPSNELFIASTGVVMTELIKLVMCVFLVYIEEHLSLTKMITVFKANTIDSPMEILKMSFSSFLYVLQNNLLYISAANLDASTNQITYQLKILATAVFSILLLKMKLSIIQWIALLMLLIGVILVQIGNGDQDEGVADNPMLGIFTTLSAAVASSLAGVLLEKMFKKPSVSVSMRNVQLSLLSLPISVVTCLLSEFSPIIHHGFFYNYSAFIMFLVTFTATNGVLTGYVIKHSDNILRNFATSSSIILACFLQIYLFHHKVKNVSTLCIGLILVLTSLFLYGGKSSAESEDLTSKKTNECLHSSNEKLKNNEIGIGKEDGIYGSNKMRY